MKTSGSTWPLEKQGWTGTIIGGCKENVLVRWDTSNKSASYTLQSRGDFKFELICSEGVKVKEESAVSDIYFLESNLQGLEVLRLPKMSPRVWYHSSSGEKHRLRVCASDNLYLLGVGLRIKEDVSRINVTISLNNVRLLYQSFEHVPKRTFSRSVIRSIPLLLLCLEELLMLDQEGRSSLNSVVEEQTSFSSLMMIHIKTMLQIKLQILLRALLRNFILTFNISYSILFLLSIIY